MVCIMRESFLFPLTSSTPPAGEGKAVVAPPVVVPLVTPEEDGPRPPSPLFVLPITTWYYTTRTWYLVPGMFF